MRDRKHFSFPDCIQSLDGDFGSTRHWKKFRARKRLIKIGINQEFKSVEKNNSGLLSTWEPVLSPILPSSTIFSPLYDTMLLQNRSLQQNACDSSRVLCITHKDVEYVLKLLNNMFDHADVFITTHNFEGIFRVLISWYDYDLTVQHLYLLQKRFNELKITCDLSFVTTSHPIYQSLRAVKSMQIFLHNFETVYLFSTNFIYPSSKIQTSVKNLIQNFGKMSSIEFDHVLNCYKCTLTNIKSAFTICKFHHFNTPDFEFYACHTPIEAQNLRSKLFYHSFKMKINGFAKTEKVDYENPSLEIISSIDICIEKIQTGEDKRMIILIKNIPNKMKYQKLKQIIDTVSNGKYNNLHLRINHHNLQNLGYAFISFKSPKYIISFYHYFHNYKWKGYQTNKICRLVYAKNQERKLPRTVTNRL